MVLRKPYAFFIKYFKVFHFVISILLLYSITRMVNFIDFVSVYIESRETLLLQSDVAKIYNIFDYIFPLIVFIMMVIILFLMSVKKKPRKIYGIGTFYSIYVLGLNAYGNSVANEMTVKWLDSGKISVISDFYMFATVVGIGLFVISLARAAGFNAKHFTFDSENLVEKGENDNEEFEFNVELDVDDIKRNAQKKIRYAKYFVKENKKKAFYGLIAVAVLMFSFVSVTLLRYKKSVTKNNNFYYDGFNITVNNSYIIDSDLKGKKLPGNKHLLILDVTISNDKTYSAIFPVGVANVSIGQEDFVPTRGYDDYVVDFGKVYNEEKIVSLSSKGSTGNKTDSANKINRILVYEIPQSLLFSNIYFAIKTNKGNYDEQTHSKFKYIKIKPTNYSNSKNKTIKKEQKDTVNFNESLLKGFELKIESMDVKPRFVINYEFKKLLSKEYIIPNNELYNEDKGLIKIVEKMKVSDNSMINNFMGLINRYGSFEYEKDGKKHKISGPFVEVKSKKVLDNKTHYIEVDYDMIEASDINLVINIRGISYVIKLEREG